MDNDTPNEERSSTTDAGIESAFEKGFDSTPAVEAKAKTEVVNSAPESVEKSQEPTVETEDDDASFTHLRPDEIPDELRPFYKSMQRDYTSKRQAERQRLKDLESKLSEVDQTREQMRTINELVQKAKNGDQMAFRQLMELQTEKPEGEEDRVRRIIREERESNFYEEAKQNYPTLDERVDEDSPVYDSKLDKWLKANLADSLDAFYDERGTSLGFDYKSEAKQLIEEWDKYLIESNKAFVQRQSAIAKKKSEESRRIAPDTSSAPSKSKRMGLDESLEAAFAEW
jgi:hypothetical protein